MAKPAAPNLSDLLTRQAHSAPDDIAVIRGDDAFSYREFDALVWGLCRQFRAAGIGPTAVVGLHVKDPALHLGALLALARLGIASAPVSTGAPASVKQSILQRVGASAVVDGEGGGAWPEPLRALRIDPAAALGLRADPDPDLRSTPESDLLMYKFSSGTTGEPKIVTATHGGMMLSIERELAGIGYPPRERYLTPVPLHLDAPRRRYLACLAGGGTCVLPPAELSAADLAGLIEQADVRHFSCVTSHAHAMASLAHSAAPRFPRMRCFRLSAGPANEALLEQVRERLTPRVWVSYGCSELGPLTVADPELLGGSPGSVGRPMPGVEVEIVGQDGGKAPPGSAGRIRLRARGMPDWYHGDEPATARHFLEGWFHPGDLGRLSADGVLFHLGRADDMMILDGMNIFPAEIEQAMLRHPAVAECVALPAKHAVVHQVPVCAVVLRQGQAATEALLLAHGVAQLGSRGPQRVVILDAMPKNEHGKVVRAELQRAMAARSALTLQRG